MTLRFYHIGNRDHREAQRVGLAIGGRGRRPRAALTAADHVRADHKITIGVEHLARPNCLIPPARFFVGVVGVITGHMSVAGQRMADQDGVGMVSVERAIRFISQT